MKSITRDSFGRSITRMLLIERKGNWKAAWCIKSDAEGVCCGDWCPLFDEPEYDNDEVVLRICSRGFEINKNDFVDERGSGS